MSVINLFESADGSTTADIPVDAVLDGAKAANLNECLVLGFDEFGGFYIASSIADPPRLLWLIENARLELFRQSGAI